MTLNKILKNLKLFRPSEKARDSVYINIEPSGRGEILTWTKYTVFRFDSIIELENEIERRIEEAKNEKQSR